MKKGKQTPQSGKSVQGGQVMVRQQSALLLAAVALLAGVFLGWQGAVMVFNQEASLAGQAGMHQQQPPAGMPQQGGMPQGMGAMNNPLMAQAKAMEEKAAKNPNDPKVWAELGNTYFDAELPDRAVAAYQKSLALNAAQPNVWTDMGVMLRVMHKPQEALKAFEQASSLDAKHEQSRLNIGVVMLFDLNDKAGALKAWKGLLTVNPEARMPDGKRVADAVKELEAK